jgi:formylglycine-generating enzyme required for sulfatase activity
MRTKSTYIFGLLILVSAITIGCGDDDPGPEPEAPQIGTITINPEPNSINAPWQITGPGSFGQSATGDSTLTELTAGSYTLTWGAVTGWTTPNPAVVAQILAADGTMTFAVTYMVQAGTITIDPEPNTINAPWQITGPDAFDQSGTGDMTFANMTAGSYTLTWGAVTGWTTPSPAAVTQTLTTDDSLTFTGVHILGGFVSIPAGTFTMGSPEDELGQDHDGFGWSTEPQHQVTLTHGIYVQTTEVTNQQYMELAQWAYDQGYVTATSASLHDNLDGSTQVLKILGSEIYEIYFSNGIFSCINPDHPVKFVNWYGSVAYCDWLSLQQGLPRAYNHATWQCNGGNPYMSAGYRLPTEAEWEYACRAGSTTAFANGPITQIECDLIDPNLDLMGWYCGNTGGRPDGWTHPVAQKLPNAWGLYDMHGNVWEWCNDWWAFELGGTVTDPAGYSGAGNFRVIRGGSWYSLAQRCRSAGRGGDQPDQAYRGVGFRPVKSVY